MKELINKVQFHKSSLADYPITRAPFTPQWIFSIIPIPCQPSHHYPPFPHQNKQKSMSSKLRSKFASIKKENQKCIPKPVLLNLEADILPVIIHHPRISAASLASHTTRLQI